MIQFTLRRRLEISAMLRSQNRSLWVICDIHRRRVTASTKDFVCDTARLSVNERSCLSTTVSCWNKNASLETKRIRIDCFVVVITVAPLLTIHKSNLTRWQHFRTKLLRVLLTDNANYSDITIRYIYVRSKADDNGQLSLAHDTETEK